MHSSGESRLECLFRNKHLHEEKKGKHFAWGTGTIHIPSLSTSRTEVLQEKVLQFWCAQFPSLLPSQLPGGCCKGVRSRLPAHPNRPPTMARGVNSVHPRHSSRWIYYLTIKKERAKQWGKRSKRQRDGAEWGEGGTYLGFHYFKKVSSARF